MLKKVFRHLSENKILFCLLILGTIAWSLTMFKSGLVKSYGMGFWGPNGHDGIWHTAIINSFSRGTFDIPIFAGERLKNYHVGFDLLVALLHKITLIPVITLYFQILPPVFAFAIGYFVYRFVYLWRKSKPEALWSVFFVYFSGSFGWLVTLYKDGSINGETLFWAQQSLSTLINPPFALSLILIFWGLFILEKFRKNNSVRYMILSVLLFALLIQVKIYAGILILLGLFFSAVWDFYFFRSKLYLYVFLSTFALSLILIIPTYNPTRETLLFQPFWFLETLVSDPSRLYWPKMASAIYNYKLAGNYLKLPVALTLIFVIFFIGNTGLRLISLPWIVKRWKDIRKISVTEIILYTMIVFGLFIPMVFIQKGNSWNSIQFFYYSLICLSIFTGIVTNELVERLKKRAGKGYKRINFGLVSVYLLLAVVTAATLISTLRHYLPARPPAMISKTELKALSFLKDLPDGVVLNALYEKNIRDESVYYTPVPLYLYESTAYVSALTGKRTYLEDEVNLEITGYDWKTRKNDILNHFTDVSYLKGLGIAYIYLPQGLMLDARSVLTNYLIYEIDGYSIYKL